MFYNTDIFEKEHIEHMVEDFWYLMEQRLKNGNISPDEFFKNDTYQFLSDKEIVYTTVSKTKLNEEVLEEIDEEDNEVKNQLREVFLAFLDTDIRYHEDYFELGGSSLQAISLINEINRKFNSNFNIVDFYGNPTVNKLYNLLVTGEEC